MRWARGAGTVGWVVLALVVGAGHVAEPSGGSRSGTVRSDPTESVTRSSTSTSTTLLPTRSFTLVAGGDVLLHPPLWEQAAAEVAAGGGPGYDFAPILADVAPTVADADLAICHLETPLAPPDGPFSGYPAFSVPPEVAPALAATGFDACSTASNHVYDRGAEGVDRTLDALDAAGIRHAGSARSVEEAGAITLLDGAGVRVALLSYSFGFNGIPAPRGEEWRANRIDEARILDDAARARRQGAEVVVVALHWGDEYGSEPNAQQEDLAPRLIGSPDVDLLLGHHAHVVQPVEAIGGEWVVYGMGNMLAHHETPGEDNEEGLLVRFTFTETGRGFRVTDAAFTVVLAERDRSPRRLVDVGRALADPRVDRGFVPRLQAAWDRTAAAVDGRGATTSGLHPLH